MIKLKSHYKRLKLLNDMKLMGGVPFLACSLKKIELARQMFLAELEMGVEVLIPMELSQDQLPASFRMYDSIVSIV